MAARIREELGVEPERVEGGYGEFTVLVGGEVVSRAGALGFAGILPTAARVVEAVRRKLGRRVPAAR